MKRIILLFALISSQMLFADEFHYVNSMIGERASGLGGAFIALSDDPSGIYHNPAGILFNFDDNFSLSANVYSYSDQVFQDIIPNQNYKYVSQNLVGNFFGYTQNFGKSKFGFAIVIPNSELFDQDDKLDTESTTQGAARLLRRKFFRQNVTTLLGPAFAFEAFKDFSIGGTLFVGNHVDKAIDNQNIFYNPDSGGTERYYFREITVDRSWLFLYPKIGMQWMPFPNWSVGATLAKKITLYSKMHVKSISNALDPNTQLPAPPTGTIADDIDQVDTTIRTDELSPLEIGVGASYMPSKTFLVSADINYFSKDDKYELSPTVSTINFACGIENYFSESLAFRLGGFTNMANTPDLVEGEMNQSPHVNLMGLTSSLSFLTANSSITVGMQYSTGTGKGQGIGGSTSIQDVVQQNHAAFVVLSSQM